MVYDMTNSHIKIGCDIFGFWSEIKSICKANWKCCVLDEENVEESASKAEIFQFSIDIISFRLFISLISYILGDGRRFGNLFIEMEPKTKKKEKINDTNLIDTVKAFPIIYDKSRAEYKRNDLRDDAWQKIAVIVHSDAWVSSVFLDRCIYLNHYSETARARWTTLSGYYSKERNKKIRQVVEVRFRSHFSYTTRWVGSSNSKTTTKSKATLRSLELFSIKFSRGGSLTTAGGDLTITGDDSNVFDTIENYYEEDTGT